MTPKSFVSDQQKSFILFMHVHLQMTAEQIRDHQSMLKPDGSKHRLATIRRWINRFVETGSMNSKPKSGRPPKMTADDAKQLVSLIKSCPKSRYPEIKRMSRRMNELGVSRRTINRVANKNGIRKLVKWFSMLSSGSLLNESLFAFWLTQWEIPQAPEKRSAGLD